MTIWALIPLITCSTYVVLCALTFPFRRKRLNQLFATYVGVAALWSFISFWIRLNIFPQQTLFWNQLLTVALVWTLVAYYHFVRAYANRPAGSLVYAGYAVVLVLAVFSFSGYIIRYAYVIDGLLYNSFGISIYFIGAVCFFFVSAGIVQLIKKYRSSSDIVERNRTMYLMIGWSILTGLAYTNLVSSLAKLPLDHVGSWANALIITYAIGKYRLLDVKLVLRKGLVYSSLTAFFTALYLLSLFIVQMFLRTWTGYTSLIVSAGYVLLVAVLFNPLRNFTQNRIDRLFYRETYDYRRVLLSFSDRIGNVLDLNELAQSILEPIVTAMHVKQAVLLFPEVEGGDFTAQFAKQTKKGEPPISLRLTSDSPIVSWLVTEGKALRRLDADIIPQLKGLWQTEKDTLEILGIELFCPVRSRSNLIGILALGSKLSDTDYSSEEIDLLMTMANEGAVALENARMLKNLKDQQTKVEQLLAQLVLIQEEERKRISMDLHDSVAQWLVAASYRAQACDQLLSGDNNDAARNELLAIEGTVSKSLKELRRVVIGLRPPALDELGLSHALQQSLEDLKVDGLSHRFVEIGSPQRLPSSVEIAVYRIIQEALNNIRKHAEATRVDLRLQFRPDRLLVEVHDNGQGFNLAQTLGSAVSVGHMGLLGMKQRVEMLGGDIKIKSGEGMGTTITLSLPIQSEEEEE